MGMKYTKAVLFGVLMLILGLVACSKENAKVEATPERQFVTKSLAPEKAEVKGRNLALTMGDLKVSMTVDNGGKEIVDVPSLQGNVKVVNTSKDLLKVQGLIVEYLDAAGKTIAFQSGQKTAPATLSLNDLKPGESSDASFNVGFPRAAVDKLGRISVRVSYIPSPLREETLPFYETVQ
jgi:hypothetical protein